MNMEKVSKIISKKVLTLDNASQVGYVVNVIFDDRVKYFTGLIIVDDESENSFILQKEDIYSMSDEVIMIKSASRLQFNISSKSNNPVGKEVYDCHGNFLGRVIDVELQGKVVKKIITSLCEFPQKFVRKSGDNFLIFGTYQKEKKEVDFKEKVGEYKSDFLPQVTITDIPKVENKKTESPMRLYANSSLLIGKTVTNDIFGYNNELIAKKYDKINQKIINKAKRHNKLIILNYYSE